MPSILAALRCRVYVLAGFIAAVSTTCYRPDGSAVDAAYQACNGSAPVSMCCHLGVANNNGDACGSGSTYGLCGVTGAQLWRESCTDQTWQSPLCLKLCVNGTDDQMVTACPDGSYCCGSNNATCCAAGQGQFIVNNALSNTSAAPSSAASSSTSVTSSSSTPSVPPSTTSSISSTSTTSTSTTTSTTTASASSGLSTSATIGLSVGIAVAVLAAVLLAAVFFWKRRQKSKRSQATAEIDSAGDKSIDPFGVGNRTEATNWSELGPENMPIEADGSASHRVEMDGGGPLMGHGLPGKASELPGSSRWEN